MRSLLPTCVLIGTGLLAAQAWTTRWTTVDDAWISARYAQHLSEGHGWVFNAGEAVEGFSNPAWTGLLAVLFRLGVEPVSALVYGGLLHALLVPTACLALAWVLAERGPHPALGMAPIIAGASPHLAIVATNGLETAQWLLALLVALTAAVGCEGRHRWWAGGLLGGLAFVRPEGLGIAAAVVVVDLVRRRGSVRTVDAWALAGGAAGAVAAVVAWRLITYGAWLPNTWAAKSHLSADQLATKNSRYLGYDGYTWPIVAATLAVASIGAPRRWAPAAAGLVIAGAALNVELWMPGARLMLPLWVLGASAFAAAVTRLRPRAALGAGLGAGLGLGALWISGVPRFVVHYDTVHSALPENQAARAARWMAAHAPAGSTLAIRDAGVFAFHVGTNIRVAELHPSALTVRHPDGARLAARDVLDGPAELLVTTVQRQDAKGSRYRSDIQAQAMGAYRYLGRVEQHYHRHYDLWVRRDLRFPSLPDLE